MDAVGICNAALDQLGADRIQALDQENSTLAELFAAQFGPVRDAVLGERAWRFATQRHEIAADEQAPAYGFAYRYAVPSVVIQVLEVSDGTNRVDTWKREGAFILTDTASPIYIRSVDQVEDVSLWPALFGRAVSTRLAAELCVAITENRSLAGDLWQLYRRHLTEAALADAKQGRGDRVFQGNLAARR